MKNILLLVLLTFAINTSAQPTFKVGWNTYQTGKITHQYTYKYTYADSTVLTLVDTMLLLCTNDSQVTACIHTPMHDRSVYKTANFFNGKKQIIKTEEYKDEGLQMNREWKYDDKNRKNYYTEDNKVNGNNYKKIYEYGTDKKTREFVVTESSYYNGKIEFYTKSYYDKNSVKYKEVRLNDNNKDIIHVESYTYGDNGRVKERSVFFPEFKVTKKFEERDGTLPAKCFRTLPLGTIEKPGINARIAFIKKVLTRNQVIIYDKECEEFEYKFTNGTNCEIIVSTTKVNNCWQVIYRFTEKLQ